MIILVASVSAQLLNATDVKHCFYNALVLNALPVPLLRQVYFFLFLRSFFLVCFLFVFLEVLEGPLGALGSILDPFGDSFGTLWAPKKHPKKHLKKRHPKSTKNEPVLAREREARLNERTSSQACFK